MEAVDESTLLAAYQLSSSDPTSWEEWDEKNADAEQAASWDNESDPLGLLPKLPPSKDLDPSVRSTLSLYSKSFDPKAFLTHSYPDMTFADLTHGLAHLRANIEQRSEALKVLVQDNFDRFVAVKATNDGVFREMREHANGPLRPEAEYGTAKLGQTLGAAYAKADQVFTPVLTNNLKATKLRSTLGVFERSKFFFNLPASIKDSVDAGKYDVALKDYRKGKYLMSTRPGKLLALPSSSANPDAPDAPAQPNSRLQVQLKRVFDNVWGAVGRVMADMEQRLFSQLKDPLRNVDEQIKTIEFLLELETAQDPVLVYLESQRSHVRAQITKTYDHCTSKVDVTRAEAAGNLVRGAEDKARSQDLAACLRELRSQDPKFERRMGGASLDGNPALSARVLKQYTSGTFFQRGTTSAGVNARVAAQGVTWSRESVQEFCSLLSHYFVLSDARPPGGSSMGPLPDWVPEGGSCFTAGVFMRSTLDELDETVTELEAIVPTEGGGDELSGLLANMRFRFTDVLSTLYLNDARILHRMEDWTPDTQPAAAEAGTTVYMRDLASTHRTAARLAVMVAGGKETAAGGTSKSVTHDLAQRIRAAFSDAMRASLDGIKLTATEQYDPSDSELGLTSRAMPGSAVTIDVSSADTRLLLSVLNVQYVKEKLLPALLAEVSASLPVSFTETGRQLRSRASGVDAFLFDQYVSNVGAPIFAMMRDGILNPGLDWCAIPPPKGVRPYIYDALLAMVEVHAHVRTVTAAGTRSGANPDPQAPQSLVERTLAALTDSLVTETLAAFQQIPAFGMGGMLQATLEIEFLHQTMGACVTSAAEAKLKQLYDMISERYRRKSPDEQAKLQTELATVRRTLVASRKTTALQFLCFRRPRPSGEGKSSSSRHATRSTSRAVSDTGRPRTKDPDRERSSAARTVSEAESRSRPRPSAAPARSRSRADHLDV